MKLSVIQSGLKLFATAALMTASLAAGASSYSIMSGDLLSVYVYRQDDMTVKVRVDDAGFIRFPLAGRIRVVGQRPEQIEKVIATALRKNGFASPEVVVSVDNFAPRSVYVLGEINAGSNLSCTIPEGGEMTAMQAISQAGGLKESSDYGRIVVRRMLANGTTKLIPVPAQAIAAGKNADDVVLKPFDTVIIPKARAISVLGTVKKSGEFYAAPNNPMTVSRAIAFAGGVERPKSLERIRVMRGDKFFDVNIRSLLEDGKGGEDMVLEPGDVVYVPETRW